MLMSSTAIVPYVKMTYNSSPSFTTALDIIDKNYVDTAIAAIVTSGNEIVSLDTNNVLKTNNGGLL